MSIEIRGASSLGMNVIFRAARWLLHTEKSTEAGTASAPKPGTLSISSVHLAILLGIARQVSGRPAAHSRFADNFPVHSDCLGFHDTTHEVPRFSGFLHSSTFNLINNPIWPEGQYQLSPPPIMHPKTIELAQTELFQRKDPFSSWDDRVRLSYIRAKAVGKAYSGWAVVWHLVRS